LPQKISARHQGHTFKKIPGLLFFVLYETPTNRDLPVLALVKTIELSALVFTSDSRLLAIA
jgi:hypothetical protein